MFYTTFSRYLLQIKMSLYKPTGRATTASETIPLAPRPSSLKGKTVALYHNDKICSFPILKTVGQLMRDKMGAETFEVHSRAPFSKHDERCIDEAIKADAVILSSAD